MVKKTIKFSVKPIVLKNKKKINLKKRKKKGLFDI